MKAATLPLAGGDGRAPSPQSLRMLGWCAAMLLIAAALMPLAPPLLSPGAPLTLEVAGEFRHVDPAAVRTILLEQLHGDFYRLDLSGVKTVVESLPWVAAARVERVWPATVRVHVREHIPYARWGERALLSQDGAVFMPLARDIPADLPQLAGPPGQQDRVREAFALLQEQLAGTPFVPQRLALDARGEWTAVTADGMELKLGRSAPLETVARLRGPVQMALEGRWQEVAYVDLHYINGFAVGWRSGREGGGSGAGALAQNRND